MLGLFCRAGGYGKVDLIVCRWWEEYDISAAVEVERGIKIGYRDYKNELMSSGDNVVGGVASVHP